MAPALRAQQEPADLLELERTAVLDAAGEAIDLSPGDGRPDERYVLLPLAPGIGRVFIQPITRFHDAVSLRFHFVVEGVPAGEPAWGVQILDGDGNVAWAGWGSGLRKAEFWSDEVPGSRAVVHVYVTRPGLPLRLVIDRVAVRRPFTAALTVTGANDLSPIVVHDPWLIALGSSVARMTFVSDRGRIHYCTGFLIGPELLLTNQHCIADQREADSAIVEFDYDRRDAASQRLLGGTLLLSSCELDYALVRLPEKLARAPLRLAAGLPAPAPATTASTAAAASALPPLVVIQHPGGEPKQVSVKDCLLSERDVPSRSTCPASLPATDFGHGCDTKKGSSGAPVIDPARGEVIGLHHLGVSQARVFNKGVKMTAVLADILARQPDLAPEIGAPQQPQ